MSSAYRVEKLGRQHAAGLLELLNDPVVAEWLGGARSRAAVDELIEAEERRWAASGYGTLVAVDAEESRLLGRAGVRPTKVGGRDEVELFYAVRPDRWRSGIASDLARRALASFFAAEPDATVVAFTLPENRASVRVMEKLGFAYEADVEHAGRGHVLYRLSPGDARGAAAGERLAAGS